MRRFVLAIATMGLLLAQDIKWKPQGSQIPGPESPKELSQWIASLREWRHERLIRMGYDGAEYARPELKWTQSSFIQPQMMCEDRYFYDPVAGHYTVDRYLNDLDKRYGGIDSVLIWPVYPNIGIDNRNQWDLHRDLPGGVEGLRKMIAQFHSHGVRVLFPVMAWDVGTRDPGMPYWEATAKLMAETGADGVNGDTLAGVPRAFRTASDATGHPVAFEPEVNPSSDEELAWNNLTWGYWTYPFVPMVSKSKWLETRHMVNVCRRWGRDKTDDLQYAFFNGVGYESWENIWGIWNQITPRDAEALRRISRIERKFAGLLTSPQWEPHTPTLQYGVYASKFPGDGETIWTVVNRNEYDVSGRQIRIAHSSGTHYYDLWNGKELQAQPDGDSVVLSFPMEAHGFGAVLVAANGANVSEFLAGMHALARTPLASYSHEWHFLPQHLVPIEKTKPAAATPQGMVRIPAGHFEFEVHGIEIEGHDDIGVDVQYPWEDSPRRYHRHEMNIPSFFIDKLPVTNVEFKRFIDATRYHPRDDHNFLRDWKDGSYPEGWGNKPVTWVSLEDARAYAEWAGKRLPHEWEWQYAAQGTDHRLYPWGNEWNAAAVPLPEKRRTMRPPTDAGAFPSGASPFGVLDLTGNVWQWTDEYADEHTRAAIVRGGSYYQPQGSHWYFPQAYKLNEHGKYLLMAPSKDRAGTLGFRCAMDAE
jgi:formylglycine-generating enzyme required for sulfatase activity